jgi:molybdenum-dependent DNA-binding transcriptional regulator ModE
MAQFAAERRARLEQFALLLAQGKTIKVAAEQVGYAYNYARKLHRKRSVQALVRRFRDGITDRITGQLVNGGEQVTANLLRLATDDTVAPQVQASCGAKFLELILRYRGASEAMKLIEELQDRINELSAGRDGAGS